MIKHENLVRDQASSSSGQPSIIPTPSFGELFGVTPERINTHRRNMRIILKLPVPMRQHSHAITAYVMKPNPKTLLRNKIANPPTSKSRRKILALNGPKTPVVKPRVDVQPQQAAATTDPSSSAWTTGASSRSLRVAGPASEPPGPKRRFVVRAVHHAPEDARVRRDGLLEELRTQCEPNVVSDQRRRPFAPVKPVVHLR